MTKNLLPDDGEPADQLLVDELATLKVLADPLRTQLLDMLRAEAQTAKQLAGRLGVDPRKLYYHINMMERHRLIRVAGTRVVSGIIEKSYRATAYVFLFDKSIFASTRASAEGLSEADALVFDTTRHELAQNILSGVVDMSDGAPPERQLMMSWSLSRMSPEQAAAFRERLSALLEEFEAHERDPAGRDAQGYRLFFALYPVRRHGGGRSVDERS